MDVYFKLFNLDLNISNTDKVSWAGLYGLCIPSILSGPSTSLSSSALWKSKTEKNLQTCTLTMAGQKRFSIASLSFPTDPCTHKGQQLNRASLGISTS